MKSKIILVSILFAVMLSSPAYGQVNSTPRRPPQGPVTPTGTVTGAGEQAIKTKLLIYAKNGLGTTSTNTGGEFPAQLVESATVDKEFSLQWSRTKAGKAEKGNLYVLPPNSSAWVGTKSVTMPALATSVDIAFSMPNLAPGTYMLAVVGETLTTGRIAVNYTGKGNNGPPVVISSGPTAGSPAQTKSPVYITGATFTPAVGAPGEANYKRAKVTLNLKTLANTTISKIEVEVWSEPWTNAELVTNSNSKNAPIMILKGNWQVAGGAYPIAVGKDVPLSFVLRRTTRDEVDSQESGPGFYSPADWGHAFAQTTNASFRWSVTSTAGKVSGTLTQSPKKPWQWGAQ